MLSPSWRRWLAARAENKSRRRRSSRRSPGPLSLEWLEKRELLAADLLANLGVNGYTPSQISQAYGFNQISFANGMVQGDGSGQTIAIVAAYNDPNLAHDLQVFDQQFGLPHAALSVLNQIGGTFLPETDPSGDWEAEEALDVEWAHAMAPGANLVLVEANSDSLTDLLRAVHTAAALPGVSVVSMSWGDAEFSTETSYDSYFTTPAGHNGVTFVAASGDNGAPPIYPAASPNVLSVGGTTLTLDGQGDYVSETAWSGSGGGISAYEAQPGYQKAVVSQSMTQRTTPDVAYDANPQTGFAVYDSYGGAGGWIVKGGTSAGAPQWAALIAIADQGRALAGEGTLDGPSQTLPLIYQMPSSNFHDITSGLSMGAPSYSAGPGYDLVTGRGTPIAYQVVDYLVGTPSASPPGGPLSSSPPPTPSPSPNGNLLGDGDFHLPSVGASQVPQPSGSPWAFLGWAGIAGYDSYMASGNILPPNDLQAAFLYNQGASILQTVSLAAGAYTLSFQAAQVGIYPGSQEQIEVLVGNMIVALVTPGPSFTTYTATFTIPTAGYYTIQFLGMAPTGSNAALLDNVSLQMVTTLPGTEPSPSPSPSSSPSPGLSISPSPSPPSSSLSGDPSSSTISQAPMDGIDSLLQSVIAAWNNFLQSELLFLEWEWEQIMMLVERWELQNQAPS